MKKFYPLFIYSILILFSCLCLNKALSQTCPSLTFTYISSESRCTSTGSITVTVTSGAGNYNYKVIGPISTPFTSSNVITGLLPGNYQLVVRDINNNCENTQANVVVQGSYADPRFLLNSTDVTCAGNNGTIDVYDVQYGRAPFDYTIVSPSPSNVGINNTTGHFTNLTPGEYAIQLRDSCGGIQVRRVTIESYSWWFENVDVTRVGCDSADVTIYLRDNKGNLNSGSLSFAGFSYGIVRSIGDTLWKSSKSFRFYIGTQRSVRFVAKDNCNNISAYTWNVPNGTKPALSGSVAFSNNSCSTFTASVTGQQNLVSPNYCLRDNSNVVIACNANGIFDNIPYGSYCITTTDNCYDTTVTRCFTQTKPTPGVAANITADTYSCTTFRASVTGQANLTNPNYCLYDNSNIQLACNTTGIFPTLTYATYTITIQNGCLDTTITRNFTVAKPLPTLLNVSNSNGNCATFTATATGSNLVNPQYCLFDTSGNVIICNTTGIFTGIANGSYCVRAVSCGDSTNSICFSGTAPIPSVNNIVQISNKTCTSFKASITGQANLTNPQYCLYDDNNIELDCNSTGIFSLLPYGSYCIKITDTVCNDTVITRCFSASPPTPTINGTIAKSNLGCTTFTATVSGTNLTSASYILFDALNIPIDTNSNGIFTNLPYGAYCAEIHDGCIDTIMKVCGIFSLNQSVSVTSSKNCTFDYTSLQINFSNSVAPYTIKIYHPNGLLLRDTSTTNVSTTITSLPALSTGLKYKVVGIDNCGFKDSVQITPQATHITKLAIANSKCPSSTWQNGSGDLTVNCSSNLYSVTPKIIYKNGIPHTLNYSSNIGTSFVFSDIEPATYVVEYTMQNCTGKLYDTVSVAPYSYPSQNNSAVYQCDNNSFSVGAVVTGGVGPYEYEIIGSLPTSPSINTSPQLSPVFAINNGTTYALIRLRTIDACGNATLNDVSVLPLQNIAVSANTTCLYNNVTLSVDAIPNATYRWYYKSTATDSTLLDDSIAYNIPFLEPEETGTYVCKVSINNDCLIRATYFNLTGDCGHTLLNSSIKLKVKEAGSGNQLTWFSNNKDQREFIIERQTENSSQFLVIGKVAIQTSGSYSFTDKDPSGGISLYRLKVISNQTTVYSNIVKISSATGHVLAYPNPVRNKISLSFKGTMPANYKLQLINAAGQLVHQEELKNVIGGLHTINRTGAMQPGIYLLKMISSSGYTTTQKLVLE